MAVEHAIFKFDDLKVTSHYDRQTDRTTTKVLSSRPHINAARPITFILIRMAQKIRNITDTLLSRYAVYKFCNRQNITIPNCK